MVPAQALSKTAEKGLFVAALLALAGVVEWQIHQERTETYQRLRHVQDAWGPPRYVRRFAHGLDRIEFRVYQWNRTRLLFWIREGRIVHAEKREVDAAPVGPRDRNLGPAGRGRLGR